MTDGALQLGAH
jgi:hypothetical protein